MLNVKELALEQKNYITEQRHYFHSHPELGTEEYNTTKHIAEELQKMGGTLQICGKWLTAEKSRLHGAEVVSQDLRGGAALVSAALAAEGFSTIRQTELIERGYERFPETLRELGAKIIVEKEI